MPGRGANDPRIAELAWLGCRLGESPIPETVNHVAEVLRHRDAELAPGSDEVLTFEVNGDHSRLVLRQEDVFDDGGVVVSFSHSRPP